MQNQNVVSDLALRASYGVTGNQEGLGNFASAGPGRRRLQLQRPPGLSPAQLPNPDLELGRAPASSTWARTWRSSTTAWA